VRSSLLVSGFKAALRVILRLCGLGEKNIQAKTQTRKEIPSPAGTPNDLENQTKTFCVTREI
jgi:hypothetical protein